MTFATARPHLVMRMPSSGRPSDNCKCCSRKSLTFNVFKSEVYGVLYLSKQSRNLGEQALWFTSEELEPLMAQVHLERQAHLPIDVPVPELRKRSGILRVDESQCTLAVPYSLPVAISA